MSDTKIEVVNDEKVFIVNLFEDEVQEITLEQNGSKIVNVKIKKL